MNASVEIEVFRAGDYGPKGTYTAEDLQQIAADYDAAWHEAPVTLDHRQEGPAFAWVAGLRCAGDVLVARLKDLHESLREWIREGAYKKRSIELYRSFTRTGRPYLRAVSFLGACPPEVKGLADPVFRDDAGERFVIEWNDPAEGDKKETAAFVEKELSGQSDPTDPTDPSDPSPSMAARIASLREEATRLATDLRKEHEVRRREEVTRFCDEARETGRILPAWETNGLVSFMLGLNDLEPGIATADGRSITPREWFQEFLRSLPPQIELREMAPSQRPKEMNLPALPQPSGRAAIRPGSLALHEQALAFCQQHKGVTYIEALQTVARM